MKKPLNQYFDHTMLKPEATEADIRELCREAQEYGFYAVCVSSAFVELAKKELEGSPVRVAAVAGFPLGACAPGVKAYEAAYCCEKGALEVDMVLAVGALKDGRDDYVREDIRAVVQAVGQSRRSTAMNAGRAGDTAAAGPEALRPLVKVILETCLLTDEEIVRACRLAEEAGADFVKTSTGFSSGGASARHVELMKRAVGGRMQVKASGGIRSLETALTLIGAGADRIGASASVQIMEDYRRQK